MAKRLIYAIVGGLALSGCCHDMGSYLPPSHTQAEFASLPKPRHVKRAKPQHASNTVLTSSVVHPSDDEFFKLDLDSMEAINRAADDELKTKLVICRGCEQPAPDGQLNSIWPTRAAEGYLSIQRTLGTLSLPVNPTSSNGRQ
jgi:hypothetical protein